jgi:hypothetical protein
MKLLQIGTFETGSTRRSWLRSKVRVFGMRKLVRKGVLANTRILDAPTHARVNRQSTARPLIGIDGIAPALLLSRERGQLTPSEVQDPIGPDRPLGKLVHR